MIQLAIERADGNEHGACRWSLTLGVGTHTPDFLPQFSHSVLRVGRDCGRTTSRPCFLAVPNNWVSKRVKRVQAFSLDNWQVKSNSQPHWRDGLHVWLHCVCSDSGMLWSSVFKFCSTIHACTACVDATLAQDGHTPSCCPMSLFKTAYSCVCTQSSEQAQLVPEFVAARTKWRCSAADAKRGRAEHCSRLLVPLQKVCWEVSVEGEVWVVTQLLYCGAFTNIYSVHCTRQRRVFDCWRCLWNF